MSTAACSTTMPSPRSRPRRARRPGTPLLGTPLLGRPLLGTPLLDRPLLGTPLLGRPLLGTPLLGRVLPGASGGLGAAPLRDHRP